MKILACMGALAVEVDAEGRRRPDGHSQRPVWVVLSYEVRSGSSQALKVDVWGRQLLGFGHRCRIDLDNGIIMHGGLFGGRSTAEEPAISRCSLVDVEVEGGILVSQGAENGVAPDEVIVPLPSCHPLGTGACSTFGRFAQPGLPFTMTCDLDVERRGTWTSDVLRLLWRDAEIVITDSNRYWRRFFASELSHGARVMGIRKRGGGVLPWQDIDEVLSIMEKFLGWIGRCEVTMPHVRGYRARRVVYKGWRVRTHVTAAGGSWLPLFNYPDNGTMIDVQGLFDGFVRVYMDNVERKGSLHLALQYLRSKERPLGRDEASIMYLDHAVRACFLLLRETQCASNTRANDEKFRRCCETLHIEDVLPGWDDDADAPKELDWLWEWPKRQAKPGCLSRALANLRNKVVHIDEPKNARLVMKLPATVQRYLTEVVLWLAELMVLKLVGYGGAYYNRVSTRTEIVPWASRLHIGPPRRTNAMERSTRTPPP